MSNYSEEEIEGLLRGAAGNIPAPVIDQIPCEENKEKVRRAVKDLNDVADEIQTVREQRTNLGL